MYQYLQINLLSSIVSSQVSILSETASQSVSKSTEKFFEINSEFMVDEH